MPDSRPLSRPEVDQLSPQLRDQARSYAAARNERGVDDAHFDVGAARAAMARTHRTDAFLSTLSHETFGDVPTTRLGGEEIGLVYFHGGGFVGGDWQSHGHIADALARGLGVSALLPNYRLAPEHPFPAAFEDAEAVYDALPRDLSVMLVGDSVGAALALNLARRARDAGEDRIRGLALFAPMLDFNARTSDYMRNFGRARQMIALAIKPDDLPSPRLTLLDSDLSNLPPVLIQVGGADYVMDDGLRLSAALARQNSPAVLECWPHMPHVWHRYLPDAPEASDAIARAAAFLKAAHRQSGNDRRTGAPHHRNADTEVHGNGRIA